MTRDARDPDDFLPLSAIDFGVLLVLADGANHGYAIVKRMEERTEGQISLLPGNLYAILQRLLTSGLIAGAGETASSSGSGKRRRNYRITTLGREVARAEAARMERMVRAAATSDLLGESGR